MQLNNLTSTLIFFFFLWSSRKGNIYYHNSVTTSGEKRQNGEGEHRRGHFMAKHQPQNAETDFPIFVKVGIESHSSPSSGHQTNSWRINWIVWWESNQEVEKASLIGCIKRSRNKCMDLKDRLTPEWNMVSLVFLSFFFFNLKSSLIFNDSILKFKTRDSSS